MLGFHPLFGALFDSAMMQQLRKQLTFKGDRQPESYRDADGQLIRSAAGRLKILEGVILIHGDDALGVNGRGGGTLGSWGWGGDFFRWEG